MNSSAPSSSAEVGAFEVKSVVLDKGPWAAYSLITFRAFALNFLCSVQRQSGRFHVKLTTPSHQRFDDLKTNHTAKRLSSGSRDALVKTLQPYDSSSPALINDFLTTAISAHQVDPLEAAVVASIFGCTLSELVEESIDRLSSLDFSDEAGIKAAAAQIYVSGREKAEADSKQVQSCWLSFRAAHALTPKKSARAVEIVPKETLNALIGGGYSQVFRIFGAKVEVKVLARASRSANRPAASYSIRLYSYDDPRNGATCYLAVKPQASSMSNSLLVNGHYSSELPEDERISGLFQWIFTLYRVDPLEAVVFSQTLAQLLSEIIQSAGAGSPTVRQYNGLKTPRSLGQVEAEFVKDANSLLQATWDKFDERGSANVQA